MKDPYTHVHMQLSRGLARVQDSQLREVELGSTSRWPVVGSSST